MRTIFVQEYAHREGRFVLFIERRMQIGWQWQENGAMVAYKLQEGGQFLVDIKFKIICIINDWVWGQNAWMTAYYIFEKNELLLDKLHILGDQLLVESFGDNQTG